MSEIKLSEVDKLKLDNINLKMQLIKTQSVILSKDLNLLQMESNAIIEEFCKNNGLQVNDISIKPDGTVMVKDSIKNNTIDKAEN